MSTLSLAQTYRFILCASALKNDIILAQPSQHSSNEPPLLLSPAVATLLSRVCNISENTVTACWGLLREVVWYEHDFVDPVRMREVLFQKFGHDLGFRKFD